jgi:hypothetical protein
MNLSFLPGDLHLSQNADGYFVVTMAGQEIISTKSRRAALAKFHSLRAELEKKFPTREPSAEEKAELLRREVQDSILDEDRHGQEKKAAASGKEKISSNALFEVQTALRGYCTAVETSDLSESSQATYLDMADNFVRWLKGDFDPGSRKAPYRRKKK